MKNEKATVIVPLSFILELKRAVSEIESNVGAALRQAQNDEPISDTDKNYMASLLWDATKDIEELSETILEL